MLDEALWFIRHLERCGNNRKTSFTCVRSSLSIMDSTAGSHLSSFCPHFPPTRTRYVRVRRFPLFAFTSSPKGGKKLCISDLRVKASPLFPSPVKAKKGTILHPQNTLYQ